MSLARSQTCAEQPSSSIPSGLMERILLALVSDLDSLFERDDVRAAVDAFAPSYLLVALPKSSSTFCTQVLARLLRAEVYKDIVVQDRFTPKDLQVASIVNRRDRATVSQVHLVATGANLRIMKTFRIPAVILLRNLFDIVISLRDHMKVNEFFSSILIPNRYLSLSEGDKVDYIIDTAVPWMVTFYVSWVQALERGDIRTEFVFYEDMIGDPVTFFRKSCQCLGVSTTDADIRATLEQVEKSPTTRFNVGKAGRGASELTANQIARIRRHADYYPGIDFRPLGL